VSTLLAVLALGFFLGMRHATDPDHVIAVSTIVARNRSTVGAALVGAVWGIGHTLTIVLVGGAIIGFRWVIPPRVGLSMELAVGVLLIGLGIANVAAVLRTARNAGRDSGSHTHGSDEAPLGWLDRRLGSLAPYKLIRPLIIGVVHGLAGSAAVALLVLATIQSSALSLLYLALFGVGTIAGMMLITMAISVPFTLTQHRFRPANQGLRLVSGVVSLAFGLFLAYQIGVVDGLFSGEPRWTPH
jgi:high-affinity nickel permease